VASIAGVPVRSLNHADLKWYIETPKNKAVVKDGKLQVVEVSNGPGWIVVFQEPFERWR
jgi:hypothetical protein